MPDIPFLDSFDHYLSADAYQKWTSAAGLTIGAGQGRRGTAGGVVQGLGMYKTFDSEYSTLWVGAAVLGPGSTIFSLYNLFSGVNVALKTLGDGRMFLSATDPTNPSFAPPVLFSGISTPLLSGIWYYIEMEAAVSSTGISVVVKVNENAVLTDSCIYFDSSRLTSHVAWATVEFEGRGGGLSTLYDDLYINNSDFYGDINIDCIRPDGPATTNWIADPAVANWLNVKDITPDGDATTVSSATVSDLDLYTMQDISSSAVVKAIQGIASVKKDTAGLAALKLQYGSGGGALFSGEYFPSDAAYSMLRDGREDITNPATINGLVFGQLRTK
jgi:hypothetical protein